MKRFEKMFIFFVILLILVGGAVLLLMKQRKHEDFDMCNPRIFQFSSSFNNYDHSDELKFPFADVAPQFGIERVKKFDDANLIFFTDYTLYDQNFNKIKYKDKCNYKIFAINGIDQLANKKILAEKLHGKGLTPFSYPLDDPLAIKNLRNDHKDGKLYIIKKNVQRQEGNLITKDIDYIVKKAWSDKYVVCQELLQDPLLINNRKINMRIYLLIVIRKNLCEWFIYNDGFMYYTPKLFESNSVDKDVNITTGYIDRKVYEENPLTIKDLYKLIGPNDSSQLQQNIEKCLASIRDIYKDDLVRLNKDTPGTKFCIYGVDIAPNNILDVTVIELNKGPSLAKHDDRDGELKLAMIRDSFAVLGIIPDNERGVHSKNFILLS